MTAVALSKILRYTVCFDHLVEDYAKFITYKPFTKPASNKTAQYFVLKKSPHFDKVAWTRNMKFVCGI
jgi:hypothetical protein